LRLGLVVEGEGRAPGTCRFGKGTVKVGNFDLGR
jgi:hypothetical protein